MKQNRSKDNSFNIGKMILWESVIMLIPAVIVPFYPDEMEIMSIFIIPAIISISIGLVAGYFEFSISNSNRLVVFIWFFCIFSIEYCKFPSPEENTLKTSNRCNKHIFL